MSIINDFEKLPKRESVGSSDLLPPGSGFIGHSRHESPEPFVRINVIKGKKIQKYSIPLFGGVALQAEDVDVSYTCGGAGVLRCPTESEIALQERGVW